MHSVTMVSVARLIVSVLSDIIFINLINALGYILGNLTFSFGPVIVLWRQEVGTIFSDSVQ